VIFQGWAKNILQGATEVAKLHFDHSKLGKKFFAKKVDGKMSNFKILEGPCPLFQTPMLLKLLLTKKLRKIYKYIYQ